MQTLQPRPAEAAATAEGTLEVVHEDHFAAGHSRHQYFLRGRGGEVTELLFDDRGPEGLGGRRVRVAGTPAGAGRMHVGTTEAVTETDTTSSGGTYNTSTAGTQKKVAVIMFTFQDTPEVMPLSVEEARVDIFGLQASGSSNTFYFDNSFGKWAMGGDTVGDGGDVFDCVEVPYDSTSNCNYSTWGSAARNLVAARDGFVDSAYQHVVHLMPPSTCRFGGVAYMPGRYSWTVANPASGPDVYGDPFNVMGTSRLERQLHGYHKGRLAWLDTSSTADTLTVSADGVHTLAPIESASGLRALRIQRTFPKRVHRSTTTSSAAGRLGSTRSRTATRR